MTGKDIAMMIATIDRTIPTTHTDSSSALEDLIGNTPLVRIDGGAVEQLLGRRLSPGVSLLAKAEWYNPCLLYTSRCV